MTAGGARRLSRDGSGNSLTTSAMQHQRGGDPTRFGTTDRTLNLVEPHNAPGKERLSQNKAAQGIGTFVR